MAKEGKREGTATIENTVRGCDKADIFIAKDTTYHTYHFYVGIEQVEG